MADYADLEIGISAHEAGTYKIDLRYTSPGADGVSSPGEKPIIPIDAKELKKYHLSHDDYGQKLVDYLFKNKVISDQFIEARSAARQAKVPLRLRLAIGQEAAELHSLRWETLYDPQDNASRLLTDPGCLFSRFFINNKGKPFGPGPKSDLKALVAVANPDILQKHDVLTPINVDGELRRARDGLGDIKITALGKVEDPSYFEGIDIRGQASLPQIHDELQKGYSILYLVCHGVLNDGETKLWLDLDEADKRNYIPGQDFVTRLKNLEQPPLLVILASCQSAGSGDQPRTSDQEGALAALGPQLARAGIPAVLAMQGSIKIKTVELFMPILFRELEADGRIDRAVAIARSKVQQRPDWWMPVLFMRSHSGRLWIEDEMPPPFPFEPKMIAISAGKFTIGSEPGQGISEYETPSAEIHLPKYWISQAPISIKQYGVFLREVGNRVPSPPGWSKIAPPAGSNEAEPVQGVTWFEAVAYCEWLKKKTGKEYSLPTEAQWEKAVQQGDGNELQWGQVREWTRTIWGVSRAQPDEKFNYPYPNEDEDRNKLGAGHYMYRVYRGDKAAINDEPGRYSIRGAFLPYHRGPRGNRYGFRVVLWPKPKSQS